MASRTLAFLIAAGAAWLAGSAAAAPLELLVPAYFYPAGSGATYWSKLAAAALKAPVTAILNPASGPGNGIDPAYTSVVNQLRGAGGKVLGYVPTGYAARPLAAVQNDVIAYLNYYAIDGIFLDEATSDGSAAHLQYYQSLYTYIKGLNPAFRVVANPGTDTQEAYLSLPTADAVVNFESSSRDYRRYSPGAWVWGYSAERFAHLAYGVSSLSAAIGNLDLAARRNAGLVYFTDDLLQPNPWDTLPSYWAGLVAEVCRRNGGTAC